MPFHSAGFASLMLGVMSPHLSQWATHRGSSFIVVSLLESSATKSDAAKILKKSMKSLKSSIAQGGGDVAGTQLVLKLLDKS
jgi:hypothetical protein